MRTHSRHQRTRAGVRKDLISPSPTPTCLIDADINSTFSAAITDLKTNLLVLNEKLLSAEAAGKHRDRAIAKLEKASCAQAQHFIEMNRHIEDLDNRGRRCNIRVRGIPET